MDLHWRSYSVSKGGEEAECVIRGCHHQSDFLLWLNLPLGVNSSTAGGKSILTLRPMQLIALVGVCVTILYTWFLSERVKCKQGFQNNNFIIFFVFQPKLLIHCRTSSNYDIVKAKTNMLFMISLHLT